MTFSSVGAIFLSLQKAVLMFTRHQVWFLSLSDWTIAPNKKENIAFDSGNTSRVFNVSIKDGYIKIKMLRW